MPDTTTSTGAREPGLPEEMGDRVIREDDHLNAGSRAEARPERKLLIEGNKTMPDLGLELAPGASRRGVIEL